MLIVQIDVPSDETTGDYYYRTYAPSRALSELPDVHVINLTNEHRNKMTLAESADILVLNMLCDIDLLPLIRRRHAQNLVTIYEWNDDVFHTSPSNPRHQFYSTPRNRIFITELARACDAIQFSSPYLREKYRAMNPSSIVFRNHILTIPKERTFDIHSLLTIGWAGSTGHLQDMAAIAQPLMNWICSRTGVKLRLMCSDPIWRLFSHLPAAAKERVPTGSIADYYNFLTTIQIGIAPLLDTSFNRSRSDVKLLEYAIHDVVAVMQDAEVYRSCIQSGINGLLFRDTAEMIQHLDRLADDLRLRIRLSQAAKGYVLRERLFRQHAPKRLRFYLERHREKRAQMRNGQASSVFEYWSQTTGGFRQGRHLVLQPTAYEQLLRDGLYLLEAHDREKAAAYFRKAAELEPHNYLPHLYLSACVKDPQECLEKALLLNPRSLMARFLLRPL
ncbi:MAG: glycosyltransferase [Desulforhabdus sp.]|jgi:hypothetical protein|nr:glycosyltransferase [Desulforhabdus sp.]